MEFNFKEVSLDRAKRILGFLSKDAEIASSCVVFAFGHWHGNKREISRAGRTHDFELLHYQKENTSIWHYLLYFFAGDRFCIRIDKPDRLASLFNALFEHYLSISFYIIKKDCKMDFAAAISPKFRENIADDFLDSRDMPYLVYRVDTDASVESGVTEELCHSENTPKAWLSYFNCYIIQNFAP